MLDYFEQAAKITFGFSRSDVISLGKKMVKEKIVHGHS